MKRKLFFRNEVFLVLLFFCGITNAQVTIFSEDFETAAGQENPTTPYLGWQSADFATTPPTNDNYFWILDNSRCNVISGNYSLAVTQNNPVVSIPLMPEYRINRAARTLVYYDTLIDATNYTNLTLDFNWICEGEIGFDFGSVLYSLDGLTWAILPGFYEGQSTMQSVTNLDLSVVDGQQFYLGFGWDNDNSVGNFPGFIVDDIDVKGVALTPCSVPNQPTVLNLAPTGDTIIGSFTAAIPNPDNYLVVVSTSATAPTPVNTTTYNIGDTIGTGTVVDIDSDTSFIASGLNQSTLYYIYVYSYNSICSGGPLYNATSLSASTTTTTSVYCTPSNEVVVSPRNGVAKYIDDVEFRGTLNDVTNINNGNSLAGYTDWTGLTNCIQAQGEGINVVVGGQNGRGRWKAWVDWDKDDVFNLATEEVYDSGGIGTTTTTFGFGIPAAQAVGDYRLRIRFHNTDYDNWSYDFNACEFFDFWNDATGNPNDGDFRLGEAEDYLFTVVQSCDANITSITDGVTCGPGAVNLAVTGSAGTTSFNWYDAQTGGNLVATTTSGTWSPVISATTKYYVTANNGSCESLVRTQIVATLNPITTLTLNPAAPTVCGENDIIQISATGDTELAYLIDEDFESGLGVFTSVNNDANNAAIDALSQWQIQTSTFIRPSTFVWIPAISSGFGSNNFVMSTSDVNPAYFIDNTLESPVLDSSTFSDLTLSFDMYFSRYVFDNTQPLLTEYVDVEVSTDGGTNWTVVQHYDNDIGYGTSFENQIVNLDAYINEPNLKVQIKYYAAYCDGVAIDNIQLYGNRALTPSFTWTGIVDAYTDPSAVTPFEYIPGNPASSVWIRPTLAQLELPDFTFTANATLSNGCTISKDIIITNNSKVWKGTTNTDWHTATNWKPAIVPDNTNCVIIPDVSGASGNNPIISGSNDGDAYNLIVKDGGNLTIEPGSTLTVQDAVTVQTNGVFKLEGANGAVDGSTSSVSGSLIQVNDVNNTIDGSFILERATFVRSQDYVYWSSPVENYALTSIVNTSFIYDWEQTINSNPGEHGNWQSPLESNMIEGKGYIIRGGPNGNGDSSNAAWNTATFTGVPHNGLVTIPLVRGSYTGADINNPNGSLTTNEDDNWNLVGNPYPSAISADDFLQHNVRNLSLPANDPSNNYFIIGTVYLWTHGTKIRRGNSPFFGDFVFNYDITDYIEYNLTGSSGGFNGYIGSGQGFFVQMDDRHASSSVNLEFNNSMRYRTYEDDVQFFRNSRPSTTNIERHRIWLDIVEPSYNVSTILLGYVEGATKDRDNMFDAVFMDGSTKKIFSVINGINKKFSIQGRPLPFNDLDKVPLGIIINELGTYAINIQEVDGLFESEQPIYLEDFELGVIHNLKEGPYVFNSTETGEFTNRFVLRYTNESLGIEEIYTNNISVSAPNNSYIKIASSNDSIYSVTLIDMLGRVINNKMDINSIDYRINEVGSSGTLFVKVILNNGQQMVKKVVIK